MNKDLQKAREIIGLNGKRERERERERERKDGDERPLRVSE